MARAIQLLSRLIGVALVGLAARLGADEAVQGEAANYAATIATAVGGVVALLLDLLIHKLKTGSWGWLFRVGSGYLIVLLGSGLLLAAPGCGALVAPGGQGHLTVDLGAGRSLDWTTSRDATIERAAFNPETGQFELTGYNGNGSTLGNVQANAVAQINQTWAASLLAVGQLVRGGAVALPGVSPGPPAASESLVLAREAALARIAACPFMGSDEKARLANLVPLAPESLLTQIVASLPSQPAAAPVVVLSQPESQPE